MSIMTESDERELVEEVVREADTTNVDELIEKSVDESGGRLNPETARRLVEGYTPD